MRNQEKKKGLFFGLEFISKGVAIPAFIISLLTLILHSCEIDNLKKLNKQHLDPNLSLLVFNGDNVASTIHVRNISILPASEIYIKRNVYFCSKDGEKIYSVGSEDPGWHMSELLPNEYKNKDITIEEKKQILFEASLFKNWKEVRDITEPVIELYAEFHRQSDLKKYSFRQMYFLKDLRLGWSEEATFKDDPYYSKLIKLVKNYKKENKSNKLPKLSEIGKYRKNE